MLVPGLLGQVGGGRQHAARGGCGGDGARVHEGDSGKLAGAGLGALAVGEVARGVAHGKAVVAGRVAGAEARAAERRAPDGACRHEVERGAQARELHAHGLRGGVHREREVAVAAVLALEGACGVQDAAEVAARAACDDALLHVQLAVPHLVE